MSSTHEQVKADRAGNYYAEFCPRGFANEKSIYRVRPEQIKQMQRRVEAVSSRDSEPGENGYACWIGAANALRNGPDGPIDFDPHTLADPADWVD